MDSLWFAILALSLATYAVMDGFDLGAGVAHLWVAHSDQERRSIYAAIGPFWDGNEVWLLAAAGTLFVAFPKVLAAAFSGFYLVLFLMLWALIFRGAAIEFRNHLNEPLWQSFWDVIFAGGSSLLALLFGVVLGNIIRGVPLDESGQFSLAFFSNFRTTGEVGLFDWYTTAMGGLGLLTLTAHGMTFLQFKTAGPMALRCRRISMILWPLAGVLFLAVSVATHYVRPELFAAMQKRPLAWLLCLLGLGGAALLTSGLRRHRQGQAFVGSCLLLYGLLGAAAAALYPVMLAATSGPHAGAYTLSVHNAATDAYGLQTALLWWIPAFLLAVSYFVLTFLRHRDKV